MLSDFSISTFDPARRDPFICRAQVTRHYTTGIRRDAHLVSPPTILYLIQIKLDLKKEANSSQVQLENV